MGRIILSYYKTDDQAANVLTKPLKIEKVQRREEDAQRD